VLLQLNQAASYCSGNRFSATDHIQLAENTFDVGLYRAFADEQLGADFFVALTRAHALENFNLAGAQSVAADAGGLPSDLNRIIRHRRTPRISAMLPPKPRIAFFARFEPSFDTFFDSLHDWRSAILNRRVPTAS
jgi:hypothetical protein